MRVINLDKSYVYELLEGNNQAEYEIVFPQLAMRFCYSKADGFYIWNVDSEKQTNITDDIDAIDIEDKESSEYKQKVKEITQGYATKGYYMINVGGKDLSSEIYDLVSKNNIKEDIKKVTMNVRFV